MQPERFLDVAQRLAAGNEPEDFRSSISRAYYAVFCRARNHLRSRYPSLTIPEDGTAHGFVPDEFRRRGGICMTVGSHLVRLRDFRNMADYQDLFVRLEDTADLAIRTAEAAMSALDGL